MSLVPRAHILSVIDSRGRLSGSLEHIGSRAHFQHVRRDSRRIYSGGQDHLTMEDVITTFRQTSTTAIPVTLPRANIPVRRKKP
jgi:hypothetical protein